MPRVNREYFEIPFDERQEQGFPILSTALYPDSPVVDIACFRGKKDLYSFVKDRMSDVAAGLAETSVSALRQFNSKQVLQETSCDAWYQYEPGRTPQEHLADYMWERLETQRKEFEERLSARAEQVQLQLAEQDQRLQTQRDVEQKRTAKMVTRITVLGIVIALLQVFTLTKDSLLWKIVATCYHWLTD